MREVLISAVNTHGGGTSRRDKAWEDVEPDMSVPDHYYTTPEYKNLSLEKKAGLIRIRATRGNPHRKGGKPSGKKRKGSQEKGGKQTSMHLSHRSIKALDTAMKDDETEGTSPEK